MTQFLTKYYIAVENHIAGFMKNQRGVTAIEYALIGVGMATLLALIFGNQNSGFLGAINTAFQKIMKAIQSVTLSK
ncbi:pilus assembly protein Flp/PilA [Enterobacter asburiae]|uniref:Flp family type IVb pilin n=1 Tax=Enterobacter asburiae TaxID=61645 RepID=UPI00141B1441|nr:Flp family type IVb pilin [Enterobacter asburiae]NIH92210.1 pilus assembly protein Flp/PilA [Enterobacter asburiae]